MLDAAQILTDGGATWSPVAKAPKSGFMVSLAGREARIPVEDFNDVRLGRYMAENELSRGQFYGAWIDGGSVYLDVSMNVATRGAALYIGARNRQLAVWDVVNEREIRVSRDLVLA
jgi:hypothetical protein